ncbi:Caffeoylshikimate esterase [Diplonema papillatum]|nr:Caffeoylshikimate esterase [Diplonema papillatum]
MSFKAEEGSFQSPQGKLNLHARRWLPTSGETKGVVILAHGYQEHSGRYEKIAKPLCEKGVAVYAMDHRGHGKSDLIDGKRAYFKSFSNLVKDFAHFAALVYDSYSQNTGTPEFEQLLRNTANPAPIDASAKLPVFIMGHSMGGLIAANYVVTYAKKPLAGLVLSSPYFMNGKQPNCCIVALGKAAATVMPHLPVAEIEVETISRDEEERKKYMSDPLNCPGKVTANVAKNFMANHDFIATRFSELKLPLLIFHGTADQLTNPKGSQLCYDLAGSKDKKYLKYEGAHHELLNELPDTQSKFIDDVVTWVVDHLKTPQ